MLAIVWGPEDVEINTVFILIEIILEKVKV